MTAEEQFKEMREELERLDERRETLITNARKLNTLAKKGLQQSHRGGLEKAAGTFKEADLLAKEIIASYEENHKHKFGAVTAALQEWCECKAYHAYAKEGRLLRREETGLETEDYLLSLADLSGELVRRAVLLSIDKQTEKVKDVRAFLDDLYAHFLTFDFRNGELRKKTDQMRWNLQKVEELLVRQ